MTELQRIVALFYSRLESIALTHQELTDTDVRESLHTSLNYYFVWGQSRDRLPKTYGMFSEAGDLAVADAVAEFLASASLLADERGISAGVDRLAILQDDAIQTPAGERYDYFIGHVRAPLAPTPPHPLRFERGEYQDD